ncbi:hypothetical protein MMC11_007130 [Xylographa trunciseda]|nr:hypothetical protein [Xylographa trunciseda]
MASNGKRGQVPEKRRQPWRKTSGAQYQPLPRGDYVRLLELKSGDDEAQIEGRLFVAAISSTGPTDESLCYEAVSYVWGAETPTHEILINGWPVMVRENLWQFLKHTRCSDESAVYWVDALCINQKDTNERNNQVQFMGTIYRAATRVLVWLGRAFQDSDLVMDFIRTGSSSESPDYELKVVRKAVQYWANRDYWFRTWIIQEFLLAKDIRLLCGEEIVDWSHIERFCRTADDENIRSCWSGCEKSRPFSLFRQRIRGLHGDTSLTQLLINNQTSHCMDPRDKVYSMINLASDCTPDHSLKVNYFNDSRALFCEVMSFCRNPPQEVFRFGEILRRLLHIEQNSVQESNTVTALQTGTLSRRFTGSVHVEQQELPVVGYETGRVISCDILAHLEAVQHDMTKPRPVAELYAVGTLPMPSRGVASLGTAEIQQMLSQLESLDIRRLQASIDVLKDINQRTGHRADTYSQQRRLSSNNLALLVVYFVGHRTKEFMIGLSLGNVRKGDTVLQYLGHDSALTLSSPAIPSKDSSIITGRVLCASRGRVSPSADLDASLPFSRADSETQFIDGLHTRNFSITGRELLLLLR